VNCVWQVVKTPTIVSNNPVYGEGENRRPEGEGGGGERRIASVL